MTEKKESQEKKMKAVPEKPAKQEKDTSTKQTKSKKTPASGKSETAQKEKSFTREEVDRLILENADLQAAYKEYQEKFLLLAAEFENFKKRIQKDQQRARELYRENILAELLPVIDDIERALKHHSDDELAKGFAMLHAQLLAYLEKYEVVPFNSVGEEFDPEKHDAMLTRALEDEKNNIILEEFQKGYMIGKKVLRHAKVIVNILD
jgi:molecular chaperone GrpE